MAESIESKYFDIPLQGVEIVGEAKQPQEPHDRKESLRQLERRKRESKESNSQEKNGEDTYERENPSEDENMIKPVVVQKEKTSGDVEGTGHVVDIKV